MKPSQFPIKLSFAMNINKAQGQTLTRVGLDLTDAVFTHGQLQVALSRAVSISKIYILNKGKDTCDNVVNEEALTF
jgi:ATP-dependent exoDNAse (exonuclease V) alpha subunit